MAVLNTGLATPATGFTIDQSLRFNDDDSAYLSKTFSSAGNRKTWTWSAWVKRGNLGLNTAFFESRASADNMAYISITSGDAIRFYTNITGVADYGYLSDALFRDPSAWYHIMVVIDTTQGTASNRAKLYVNGVQQSFDQQYGDLPEDHESQINSTDPHKIGYVSNEGFYSDTYLAEVHFIDGTALTPTSFGETGDYGEWKAKEVTGLTYGTNGFYLSFAGGGIMSATGGDSISTDGDYKIHTFTSSGTFTPTSIDGGGWVEYLVVGGGGAGGANVGGGGGGGASTTSSFVPVDTPYTITVGTGGAGVGGYDQAGDNGVASSIAGSGLTTITADYGDGGITVADGYINTGEYAGGDGGTSGGGRGGDTPSSQWNTNNTVGANGTANSLSGSSITYGSGGGGGGWDSAAKAGGTDSTTANSGGGGLGASGSNVAGSDGQDGVVIIKYKFQ